MTITVEEIFTDQFVHRIAAPIAEAAQKRAVADHADLRCAKPVEEQIRLDPYLADLRPRHIPVYEDPADAPVWGFEIFDRKYADGCTAQIEVEYSPTGARAIYGVRAGSGERPFSEPEFVLYAN